MAQAQEYAIEVQHVAKSFKVFMDKGHELKDHIISSKRRRYERREVLKDISFSVRKGEAIGLIGHNGCGKSTTLKMLSKIMYPDSGTIRMNGRVSCLIELGAGFHPDMSGRENIYINASIFGLTKKEIDQRIDEIIAFSELEDFIDNPVRTYSSGMYMRLAFSVAINVDADILLVDEILSVGDINFQRKCYERIREVKKNGTTIIIVSHSLEQIEEICDRTIWIHDGVVQAEGNPQKVHMQYLDFMANLRIENLSTRWGNEQAEITGVYIVDKKGDKRNVFQTGEDFIICFNYTVKQTIKDAIFGIGIFRNDGVQCYGTNTRIDEHEKFDIIQDGTVRVECPGMALLPGNYVLDVTIQCGNWIPVDYYRRAYEFAVVSDRRDIGVFRLTHNWILDIKN